MKDKSGKLRDGNYIFHPFDFFRTFCSAYCKQSQFEYCTDTSHVNLFYFVASKVLSINSIHRNYQFPAN